MQLFNKLGLVERRQAWALTWRGWLLVLVFFLLVLPLTLTRTNAFLSVNHPTKSHVLVVEGWVSDSGLKSAAAEFHSGPYDLVLTCGGPLSHMPANAKYQTHAEVSALRLIRFGVPSNSIVCLPAPATKNDRTFTAALAVRDWLTRSNSMLNALNVFSVGPHARRSRLLFQKALGDAVDVGILCVPDDEYNPATWWKASAGFRDVCSEAIGYVYVRIFFRP